MKRIFLLVLIALAKRIGGASLNPKVLSPKPVQWPNSMTTDDLEDVELWLDMMKRKLKRVVAFHATRKIRVPFVAF